jgi:excinuclease ABC subunit C
VSHSISLPGDPTVLDAALETVADAPAVFAIWPRTGAPYLSKTSRLHCRLRRLLAFRAQPSRALNLRETAVRIEYWPVASALESSLVFYDRAREFFPASYSDLLRSRPSSWLQLVMSNRFPRSRVTTHLGRGPALYFGPFRSRASAEQFESGFLDLFQIRRCQEDLAPSPEHPGCMYGEMGRCLRPCQDVVGPVEYAAEVDRAAAFLRSGGRSLLDTIAHSRDRFSEEMLFEDAARQHKRYERVKAVLALADPMARDLESLDGVAITRSVESGAVELWPVRGGSPLAALRVSFDMADATTVSLDQRLRELLLKVEPAGMPQRERAERLALLARWYFSSWRDGEWVSFDSYGHIPYRKLVHAISRLAKPATSEV